MKNQLAILLLTGATFLTGCGSSNDGINEISGQQGNPFASAAPVCADDAYATNANQTLTVNAANGVLANDTPNGASLTFDAVSGQGGTVAMNQDGSFTYTPPSSTFSGVDTFSYVLTNIRGTVTCTVTITVTAVNGFFVDAANGNDTTGSFNGGNPFATIQAAAAAAPAGSDIVVRAGSYTGTVNLDNGDRLLGEGSVLAQGAAVRPTLTGPVVMGDGCTVDFIRIDGTASNAIDGDGQNGGTVTNCEIANTTAVGAGGIQAFNASGSWTVSNNAFSNTNSIGVDLRAEGNSTLTARVEENSMTNCGGALAFISEGTSTVNASVKGNDFLNSEGVGSTFELTCAGDSNFCLDLENNANDVTAGDGNGVYRLVESATPSELRVEQLNDLTTAQPTGAGNTGTVSVATGTGFDPIADVADGTCGF